MDSRPELILVNPALMLPFGMLLALIALAPLLFPVWWGRHYPKIACGLGAFVAGYYLLVLHAPGHVWHTASEYLGFIALVGSLFVVSGGIHIDVKGGTGPRANVLFLLIGAVAANLLGTTGASMLLIRPWLRMNQHRFRGYHLAFFLFLVSNVGGCLTPVGDPPLFLGYLEGIPFWWVGAHCLPAWGTGVGILLVMFAALDCRDFRRAPQPASLAPAGRGWRFDGLGNLFFLGIILAAVFIHQPPFLRETLMTAAAAASYLTTKRRVHEANHFTFHPLNEVAILFIGIFATMMPALDWLQARAASLDHPTPGFFYFGCGILSSVLDNAPTYLCFLKTIFGRFVDADVISQVAHLVQTGGAGLAGLTGEHAVEIRRTFEALQQYHAADVARGSVSVDAIQVGYLIGNPRFNGYLLAISIGSVFFGANTYIGNGPNFMVKGIAEQARVATPSFLAFIWKYTLPYMVPMLLIVWWLFFRE